MKVGVTAVRGRIGKLIAYEVYNNNLFDISSALIREGYDEVGRDIGEFLGLNKTNTFITDNINTLFENSDVVVDFSSPKLTLRLADIASEKNKTLISGTRGLTEDNLDILKKYSNNCRIIYSENMSIGLNLLMNLLEKTASLLGENFDINIEEFKNKLDNVNISKTTAEVAKAIAKGRGWEEIYKKTNNTEIFNEKQINFASLRGGDKISERTIFFNSLGEELQFKHSITNNLAFVKGVIRAIIWSSGQNNGFYTMRDVMEIENM